MKILEIIPQLGSGGAERFVVDICNVLSEKNNVTICIFHSLEKHGFYKNEISENVKVVCLNKKNGFDSTLPYKLNKLIKEEKPDIVHTHLSSIIYTALPCMLNRKVKFFHTIHNEAKGEAEGKLGTMVRKFLFKRKFVTPVTISPESLRSFKDFYNMDAPLINNGRDIPAEIKISRVVEEEFKSYRRNPQTRVIVQLAHVGHQKRQDIMARVADKLISEGHKMEILFIGEIHEQKMAESINEINNPHLHILGGKHNPLEYLKMADAFALTSSVEGLPISLIEAMGVGAIPVCTPAGGIVNLVKDGENGFLSSNISEEAYYKALKNYMETSNEELANMRIRTLEAYKPYSMKECANNYIKLWKER